MRRNGEYVGVDDRFIPENERYVDESILGTREESRKTIGKVAKGLGIGYLCFLGFIAIFMITIIVFVFNAYNRSMDIFSETQDKVLKTQEIILEETADNTDVEYQMFNSQLEDMMNMYQVQTNNLR